MPRLFVSNFEFEDELAGRPAQPRMLQALRASMSGIWSAIAESGDRVFDPDRSDPDGSDPDDSDLLLRSRESTGEQADVLTQVAAVSAKQLSAIIGKSGIGKSESDFELVPWGWSDSSVRLAEDIGLTTSVPELSCVRAINDRKFGFDFETERSIGLAGSKLIHGPDDLVTGVEELHARQPIASHHQSHVDEAEQVQLPVWIVKQQFSASGRHCLRGQGVPGEQQLAWVRKRCVDDAVLFFEPYVNRVREAGFQYWLDESGVRFDGCVEMICDRNGQYRGSIVAASMDSAWAEAELHCAELASRIYQKGYFGPLGIDAMLYRQPDGSVAHRSIQDVNGRFTMGRIALSLKNRVAGCDDVGIWLHCDKTGSDDTIASELARCFPEARMVVPTSTLPMDNNNKQSGSGKATSGKIQFPKRPFLVVCPKTQDVSSCLAAAKSFLSGE